MSKPEPPEEYRKFDALMGRLLQVPKPTLDERVQAHKRQAALNPKKRGPKPKVRPSAPSADPDAL